MGKFALQTSPCSFLKLRISPWEISFPLLLCSLIPGAFIFFPTGSTPLPGSILIPTCFSPSLFLMPQQGLGGVQQLQAMAPWGHSCPGQVARGRHARRGAERAAHTSGGAAQGAAQAGRECGPRPGGGARSERSGGARGRAARCASRCGGSGAARRG
jgi:hypothetical protein